MYLSTTGAADQLSTALEWELESMTSGRKIMRANRATTAFMLTETGAPNFEDGTYMIPQEGFFFNWKLGAVAGGNRYICVSLEGIEYL